MTPPALSLVLVAGWFLAPQLAGLASGWRGVAVATVVYAVLVPLASLTLGDGSIYLAGSWVLLPLMAAFVVGLNVALFGLFKTIGDLFRPKTDPAPDAAPSVDGPPE